MNNASGIYKITSPSGNFYIGSATNFRTRWALHRHELNHHKHANAILQHAVSKYGIDNLIFTPILYCEPKDLLLYEQLAIDIMSPSYNICKIAGSVRGVTRSLETRRKIANAHMGKLHTEETKKLLSKLNSGENNKRFGVTLDSNTKAKISQALTGKYIGKNNKHYGVKRTEDTKRKISLACSGKNHAQFGCHPWENRAAKKELWAIADTCYQIWIHNGKPTGYKLKAIMMTEYDCNNIVKYFLSGWIPKIDEAWVSWVSGFNHKGI